MFAMNELFFKLNMVVQIFEICTPCILQWNYFVNFVNSLFWAFSSVNSDKILTEKLKIQRFFTMTGSLSAFIWRVPIVQLSYCKLTLITESFFCEWSVGRTDQAEADRTYMSFSRAPHSICQSMWPMAQYPESGNKTFPLVTEILTIYQPKWHLFNLNQRTLWKTGDKHFKSKGEPACHIGHSWWSHPLCYGCVIYFMTGHLFYWSISSNLSKQLRVSCFSCKY